MCVRRPLLPSPRQGSHKQINTAMKKTRNAESIIKAGLRSIAAAVPGTSGLAQLWNEYDSHVQLRRIEAFFAQLQAELVGASTRLDTLEVRVQATALPELIERAVEHARHIASERKRLAFARVIARAVTNMDHAEPLDGRSALDTLDELTDFDIHLLSLIDDLTHIARSAAFGELWFAQQYGHRDNWVRREQETPPDSSLLVPMMAALAKLESRALLEDCTPQPLPEYVELFEFEDVTDRWLHNRIRVSRVGHYLLGLLELAQSN
jgi:hypothetical protein